MPLVSLLLPGYKKAPLHPLSLMGKGMWRVKGDVCKLNSCSVEFISLPRYHWSSAVPQVVILFLGGYLFDLCMYGIIVGGGFHVADYAEGNREVRAFHQGKFQLQGVVLAMGVVDKNILFRDAVLAELHHFQPEALPASVRIRCSRREHGLAMSR